MVRILEFYCRGPGSNPGHGTEIQQAMWHGKKIKKRCSNKKSGTLDINGKRESFSEEKEDVKNQIDI